MGSHVGKSWLGQFWPQDSGVCSLWSQLFPLFLCKGHHQHTNHTPAHESGIIWEFQKVKVCILSAFACPGLQWEGRPETSFLEIQCKLRAAHLLLILLLLLTTSTTTTTTNSTTTTTSLTSSNQMQIARRQSSSGCKLSLCKSQIIIRWSMLWEPSREHVFSPS